MDSHHKINCTVDALYGAGASAYIPPDITMTYYRTGRIREVYHNGTLLCTLRIDGGLAITLDFARILLQCKGFDEYCIEVDDDAAPFVAEGKSVFASHVVRCGKHVRISSDVPILHNSDVIAVGRAVLSEPMIAGSRRGVVARVRDSLKRRGRIFSP